MPEHFPTDPRGEWDRWNWRSKGRNRHRRAVAGYQGVMREGLADLKRRGLAVIYD